MKEFIGGQAVSEGVMLLSRRGCVVAVQQQEKVLVSVKRRKPPSWVSSIPFVRGIIALRLMVVYGLSSMAFANKHLVSSDEDVSLSDISIFIVMLLSLVLAVFLFKVLPLAVASAVAGSSSVLFSFVDALVRFVLIAAYVYVAGFVPEVARIYQYHGAEHKVIRAYELGDTSIESIRSQSPYFERCGTTFIVLILLCAAMLFSFIPLGDSFIFTVLVRIALLVPVVGITYEFLRFVSVHQGMFNWLLAPGLWFQRLTVKEPSDDQIRVALAALTELRKL